MNNPTEPLCNYRYDPLDRLVSRYRVEQGETRYFYQKDRVTSEHQSTLERALLQTGTCLLAQQQSAMGQQDRRLIATDLSGSVLQVIDLSTRQAYAYMPYGHRHPKCDPLQLPAFNREQPDPVTGHYLLGNGYRAFNPVLMRFNNPDSLSPFGAGGLNSYAYCAGDPVNAVDPDGHLSFRVIALVARAHTRFRSLLGRSVNRARSIAKVQRKALAQPVEVPTLQQTNLKKFTGNQIQQAMQETPYSNALPLIEEKFGPANFQEYIHHSTGSLQLRTDQAIRGQGPGFLPRTALPFSVHLYKYEQSLDIIKNINPVNGMRDIRMEIARARVQRNHQLNDFIDNL